MFRKDINEAQLEDVLDRAFVELQDLKPGTDEYSRIAKDIDTLYRLKAIKKPGAIESRDVLNVAGSLVTIFSILSFEQTHALTSKALGFVMKLRA